MSKSSPVGLTGLVRTNNLEQPVTEQACIHILCSLVFILFETLHLDCFISAVGAQPAFLTGCTNFRGCFTLSLFLKQPSKSCCPWFAMLAVVCCSLFRWLRYPEATPKLNRTENLDAEHVPASLSVPPLPLDGPNTKGCSELRQWLLTRAWK